MQNNSDSRKTKNIKKNNIDLFTKFIFDMVYAQFDKNNYFGGGFGRFNDKANQQTPCN